VDPVPDPLLLYIYSTGPDIALLVPNCTHPASNATVQSQGLNIPFHISPPPFTHMKSSSSGRKSTGPIIVTYSPHVNEMSPNLEWSRSDHRKEELILHIQLGKKAKVSLCLAKHYAMNMYGE
jgi:hypothetical protein